MSVLSDTTIRRLIAQNKLILNGDPARALHCSYEFKAGRIVYGGITPPSQQVTAIDLCSTPAQTAIIQPSGVAWVRSHEQVQIPANMVGMWIQTNSLSRSGLLLLNSTLVEPGYEGYLSAHFVNLGTSPVSLSATTTIAKLVFAELDAAAAVLLDSKPFKNYDALIDGLAAQSNRSFLRIGELVPDLSKAADSSVVAARSQIKSITEKSLEQTKSDLENLTKKTFRKVAGGFVVGFILAVVFALWIFPALRGVDDESKRRISLIVSESNAELTGRLKMLEADLRETKSSLKERALEKAKPADAK